MAAQDFQHRFVPGESALTLLLLHGTGGDENDLLPLGKHLAPDANLLSPRGKVLENGMPRFFRRLAMGVFDVEDLKARTDELELFVSDAASEYGLSGPIVAVGYSNGANIGASLLLRHPKLLRGAGLLHAMVPYEPEGAIDLSGTSVLMTAGERDPMIPLDQTQALEKILREAGADVELHLEPGGHELTQAEVDAAARWVEGLEMSKRA
jgi:phospholipase/carboxylesterase